jgi:CheY-like chemotaxis protein
VLIVDDEPDIRIFIAACLEEAGFNVDIAVDGIDAMDKIRADQPDLITLDLQMPGEWGPRFYRKLRQDRQLRETPVIVISGIDGDHAIKDAVAFLQKPFDPEKLIGIVKNTIG